MQGVADRMICPVLCACTVSYTVGGKIVLVSHPAHAALETLKRRQMRPQRKNLIDLGHDLGNRDQDKVDPGQESRS